jgi:hypothetical protein
MKKRPEAKRKVKTNNRSTKEDFSQAAFRASRRPQRQENRLHASCESNNATGSIPPAVTLEIVIFPLIEFLAGTPSRFGLWGSSEPRQAK